MIFLFNNHSNYQNIKQVCVTRIYDNLFRRNIKSSMKLLISFKDALEILKCYKFRVENHHLTQISLQKILDLMK